MSMTDYLRPEWTTLGACSGTDPGMRNGTFFPTMGGTYDRARAYCKDCPVRAKCLRWALAMEGHCTRAERAGMYGGLTPDERHNLRKPSVCRVCGCEIAVSTERLAYCSEECFKEAERARDRARYAA